MEDRKPDLAEVMRHAGVDVPAPGMRPNVMARCPFHNDRGRPNMSVNVQAGLFHCFRCHRGGDVFDFEGLLIFGDAWNHRQPEMFKEVLRRLDVLDVPLVAVKPPPPPRELSCKLAQVLGLASRVYHLSLMGKAGRGARAYLQSRNIDEHAIRKLRIGYAAKGALLGALAGYPPGLKRAAELAGLFVRNDRDELREWLLGRVIFADITQGGTVRHMIGRSLQKKPYLKYLSLAGLPKTIWGLGDIRRDKPVILTESIIDAVNLRQMGFQGTSVNGTGIASYLLPELQKVPVLLILRQNDAAGIEAADRWMEQLPRARLLDHTFSGNEKDLNDQVLRHGLSRVAGMVREAMLKIGIKT